MSIPLPVTFTAADGTPVASLEMGGAEGAQYPTLRLHQGDIINVRNIQGGTVEQHNLDLSAGGAGGPDDPRGDIGLQWDNGNAVRVYDGRKKLLFATNPGNDKRVHSYAPHRFHAGALVPDGAGGWRHLT